MGSENLVFYIYAEQYVGAHIHDDMDTMTWTLCTSEMLSTLLTSDKHVNTCLCFVRYTKKALNVQCFIFQGFLCPP